MFKGLRGQLLTIGLIPTIILFIAGAISIVSVIKLQEAIEDNGRRVLPSVMHSKEIMSQVNAISRFLWSGSIFYEKQEQREKNEKYLLNAMDRLKKSKAEMEKLNLSEKSKALFKTVMTKWDEASSVVSRIIDIFAKNQPGGGVEIQKIAINELRPIFLPLEEALNELDKFMLEENDIDLQKDLRSGNLSIISVVVSLLIGLVLTLIATFAITKKISTSMSNLSGQLHQESNNTKDSANSVASASHELAQAATEQAAALQETASSIEEMSAMIAKNSDNAQKSIKVAGDSLDAVRDGQHSAEQIVGSMNEIKISNESILARVEESNKRITDVSKVIYEIGEKTKIINDIVFQTKLLSFNASVEAARAGEAGKGFSVVAEEVGNLAAMSGKAAKEISGMITSSVLKVESIVEDTKRQVGSIIQTGQEKLNAGIKVVEQNKEILQNIANKVAQVNEMVSEIATATKEQSTGVGEISKAMGQLDQVTQQNSTASQQIAGNSEKLMVQATSLEGVVANLEHIIRG